MSAFAIDRVQLVSQRASSPARSKYEYQTQHPCEVGPEDSCLVHEAVNISLQQKAI
jgi:hypothetical protein